MASLSHCWGKSPIPQKPTHTELQLQQIQHTSHLPVKGFCFSAEHEGACYLFLYKHQLDRSGWLRREQNGGERCASGPQEIYKAHPTCSMLPQPCVMSSSCICSPQPPRRSLIEKPHHHHDSLAPHTLTTTCCWPKEGCKTLLQHWGFVLWDQGWFFCFPVISLNYRKSDRSSLRPSCRIPNARSHL